MNFCQFATSLRLVEAKGSRCSLEIGLTLMTRRSESCGHSGLKLPFLLFIIVPSKYGSVIPKHDIAHHAVASYRFIISEAVDGRFRLPSNGNFVYESGKMKMMKMCFIAHKKAVNASCES
jgi:hypothetical protein